MQTTHLTDQRHVVIPKTICDAYHLNIGQELEIELTPQGILLKPKTSLPTTKLEDVAGCLAYQGEPKTIEEMNEAIQEGVATLWVKMIAIDTNIVVRFLTRDDEAQYQKAYKVFAASESIFIPKTVILETEWVLRFSYKFSSERIVFALSNLLGLENIISENKELIIIALQWHEQGMDFADALHLSFSLHTQNFLSFDKQMIKKATSLNVGIDVIEP